MKSEKLVTAQEFDQRLTEVTEQFRQERLALEAQNAQLRELVTRYMATLETLEAELTQAQRISAPSAAQTRETLKQLAERSVAVAASL